MVVHVLTYLEDEANVCYITDLVSHFKHSLKLAFLDFSYVTLALFTKDSCRFSICIDALLSECLIDLVLKFNIELCRLRITWWHELEECRRGDSCFPVDPLHR